MGRATTYERLRSEILSCKILIVEDDFLSRTVLREVFRKEGFESIHEAENGKLGLEKATSLKPDIIISDILMPEMNGFELCRHIRQHADPHIARVPILIQTGLTQESDKARVFEAGATDYLTKPIEAREVIARCAVHLERAIILQRLRRFNEYLSRERGEPIQPENLEGDFWSFKRLSTTINVLLDEIELSHYDLKQAQKKAEAANKVKIEFLASITHDLKTPVHCIVNFAQIGASDADKGKATKEHFTDILANGRRLDTLISDILDFTMMESGNMEFSMKPHSIRAVVDSAVKFTHALADEKQVSIVFDDCTIASEHLAMVDPRRLEQAFVNLMTNAIRFSPTHGTITWRLKPDVMIIAGTDITVPAICITIEDQGPGIPEETIEHIFEPFSQGNKTQKRGGNNGLGLTICRRMLQAFYGNIRARTPEGGALFEILLPLHQPSH